MPLRRLIQRILLGILFLFIVLYVGDFLFLRIRMRHATSSDPYETVTAYRIIAIGEKGNKTEYDVDPVQPQQSGECVHALFPHSGDPPCWYLKRKFAQPIPMSILFQPTR